MQIAFMMDRPEFINPLKDTTSHLLYECNQRGHAVFFLEPHDLYIRKNGVMARMRNITVRPDLSMKRYWRSVIGCLKKEELIFENIVDLDVLFLRKNPPLIAQVMEFLDPLNNRVFMINSVRGQIHGNSKLYILNFPEIIPETHISRNPVRLKKIIEDFGGSMVIKPLQRYGGEGVIKVSVRDQENLNSLINYYVQSVHSYAARAPVMVQEYLEVLQTQGDVRILLLNGEIIGAMRRIPRQGDFRTNVLAGARAYEHEATAEEKRICAAVKNRLLEDGLYFVGIDIIGSRLVGINCLSPGGIPQINRLSNVRLESKVVDFVEQKRKEPKEL